MPGLVAFRRRWSIGSDDLLVPGLFFLILHAVWLVGLSAVLALSDLDRSDRCQLLLLQYCIIYIVLLSCCLLLEMCIIGVSMRGGILNTAPRASMPYLIYTRLVVMVLEVGWMVVGVLWLTEHYHTCQVASTKEAIIGCVVCTGISTCSLFVTAWCAFDPAGRSWVKMKRFQRIRKDGQGKYQYKRSSSNQRNWRQRKVLRAYRNSWNNRCRLLFCCLDQDRNQNSFADIAELLSEFFRDLDIVPSDIVAGLALLRKLQKLEQQNIVRSSWNDTYQFLSGVRITPNTTFLGLNKPAEMALFRDIVYYMRFALAIYGWPIYMMQHSATGCCTLCPYLRCCGGAQPGYSSAEVLEDNCCMCNTAAARRMAPLQNVQLIYLTYHVDVGETPFMVGVDHHQRSIIVCIRGTMSMKDVVTDLDCEGEPIPTNPNRDDWLGHKGMVQAAVYIRNKLAADRLLEKAFLAAAERSAATYDMVLVGHSLGAGTAAILAILLKDTYPQLQCFAYSPPGGLLSMPAVEYSKQFITSVVVGKDVVPRIGLHQMEQLRSDLIEVIKYSEQPKWQLIAGGLACCGRRDAKLERQHCADLLRRRAEERQPSVHPSDSTIALTVHQPLYPPGRVVHIVRHHPAKHSRKGGEPESVFQAVWVENDSFDEVLISPVMMQDHMPDKVLQALEKVLTCFGPTKPQRSSLTSSVALPSFQTTSQRQTSVPTLGELLLPTVQEQQLLTNALDPEQQLLTTAFDPEKQLLTAAPSPEGQLVAEDAVSLSTLQLVWEAGVRGTAPLASPDTLSNSSSCCDDRQLPGYKRRPVAARVSLDSGYVNGSTPSSRPTPATKQHFLFPDDGDVFLSNPVLTTATGSNL